MKKLAIMLMILILLILPGLASQTDSGYTPEELLAVWNQVGAMLRENGTYPYVELRNGDTGYEVMALQTRLKELGYYDKEVVPTFGGGTGTAMRLFEKVNNIKVNGWASVEDQQLLFKPAALASSGMPLPAQAATLFPGIIPSNLFTATPAPQGTNQIVTPSITPKSPAPTLNSATGSPVTTMPPTPTPDNTPDESVPDPSPTIDPN
jgi:peptidoglycan hydrolase-like protein with peptidoglycan-binding domain